VRAIAPFRVNAYRGELAGNPSDPLFADFRVCPSNAWPMCAMDHARILRDYDKNAQAWQANL
jgi:hypothetical protein